MIHPRRRPSKTSRSKHDLLTDTAVARVYNKGEGNTKHRSTEARRSVPVDTGGARAVGSVYKHWTRVMRRTSSDQGKKALRKLHEAAEYDNKAPRVYGDEILNPRKAETARAEAETLLTTPGLLVKGVGEVALWDPAPEEKISPGDKSDLRDSRIFDTLEHPNTVSVRASEQRMEAADGAGVLEAAVDAAVSVKANNSLEKMLCHQMAAAHHMAMTLIMRAADTHLPPVEAARLTNAGARLMQVYTEGLLALKKFRSGGQQKIVVQHIQVADGGQAVIAGSMKAGHRGAKSGEG